MKPDTFALLLRWTVAWFLLALLAAFLLLAGSAQMFLESSMAGLALFLRWACWGGLIVSAVFLAPAAWKARRRRSAVTALAAAFAVGFLLISVWDAWVRPAVGAQG